MPSTTQCKYYRVRILFRFRVRHSNRLNHKGHRRLAIPAAERLHQPKFYAAKIVGGKYCRLRIMIMGRTNGGGESLHRVAQRTEIC